MKTLGLELLIFITQFPSAINQDIYKYSFLLYNKKRVKKSSSPKK